MPPRRLTLPTTLLVTHFGLAAGCGPSTPADAGPDITAVDMGSADTAPPVDAASDALADAAPDAPAVCSSLSEFTRQDAGTYTDFLAQCCDCTKQYVESPDGSPMPIVYARYRDGAVVMGACPANTPEDCIPV